MLAAASVLLLAVCSALAAPSGLGLQPQFPSNQGDVSVKGVVDAIRFALVGSPEYHAKQAWPFDPEEGSRRGRDFQALNGPLSAGLIERLGLGEDGLQEERRQQQAIRDIGVPITGKRRRRRR